MFEMPLLVIAAAPVLLIVLPLAAVAGTVSAGPGAAKRQVDEILRNGLKLMLARPVFYPVGGGWRALAKAHMEAVGAPVKVVHGYALEASVARDFAKTLSRASPARLAATPGVAARRARTLPAAALVLDRVLKRLAPERVVFSALGLREGLLYSQLETAEQYRDPLVEGAQLIGLPLARVPDFAPALAAWTANLFSGETPAEKRLRVAVCALSDIAWRDGPDLRAEESFRRLLVLPFIGLDHADRVFIAAVIHARYAGVRLEVAAAARAPDSEVVLERLRLLASAIGVPRATSRTDSASLTCRFSRPAALA